MTNKVQTKSQTIAPDPAPIKTWATDHAAEILFLLLLTLGIFVFYRKAARIGRDRATRAYDEKIAQLRNEQYHLIEEHREQFSQFTRQLSLRMDNVANSHSKLESSFINSKLIPNLHVLIPYTEEGVSHHRCPNGYVMRVERKFEHRATAEEVLGRALATNEVVHHIYGPAIDDNSVENLCVLDREQHDFFHTFLERDKKLKNKYPRIEDQKRHLKQQYKGILLEEAIKNKNTTYPPIQPQGVNH